MKEQVERISWEYMATKNEVERELKNLPNYGSDCNCDECEETVKLIHEGNICDEIMEYCLNCGGYIV